MYHGRGTLGKSRNRVNVLWNVCLPVNSRGKQALLNVQIMISDRFSYRYRIIEFYGALNCLDYYLSLNLGYTCIIAFFSVKSPQKYTWQKKHHICLRT